MIQAVAAQLQAIDHAPAAGAADRQRRTPAAGTEGFPVGAAAEPHHLGAQPAGVCRQFNPALLFVERAGVQHQLLGQPFEIGAVLQAELQHLPGPLALGRPAGAAD